MSKNMFCAIFLFVSATTAPFIPAADAWKPYSSPCTERKNVFSFTKKPVVKALKDDHYKIHFAVKDYCDVTVAIIDDKGKVIRHLASGVLGSNAPTPFQRNSLEQNLQWNGQDDLLNYIPRDAKVSVRVMLGMKPEFDKQLNGNSKRNITGWVKGLGVDEKGVYVWSKGRTPWKGYDPFHVRQFDHDGAYVKTVSPPPADLPEKKRGGFGYVEYEPGRRELHGPMLYRGYMRYGWFLVDTFLTISGGVHDVFSRGTETRKIQPTVSGGRMFYMSSGIVEPNYFRDMGIGKTAPTLHWIHTDGSSTYEGMAGRELAATDIKNKATRWFPGRRYQLAASPDGKWIYITGIGASIKGYLSSDNKAEAGRSAVLRCAVSGGPATLFAGDLSGKTGFGEGELNGPRGLDCDALGRVYIAEINNHRIQVFSPDGKSVGSVGVKSPRWLGVHKKTGEVYVLHKAESAEEVVSKFSAFPELKPVFEIPVSGLVTGEVAAIALDSWAPRPRLWLGRERMRSEFKMRPYPGRLMVWEDNGKGLRKYLDFDEAARKDDGDFYRTPWHGAHHQNVLVADPTREKVYWKLMHGFDLRTGKPEGHIVQPGRDPSLPNSHNYRGLFLWDAKFCRRGFVHSTFKRGKLPKPGIRANCFGAGVVRMNPAEKVTEKNTSLFAECPYDYGREFEEVLLGESSFNGVLEIPTHCYRGWTRGLGVNMRGDVAVASLIWYVPKMEDGEAFKILTKGSDAVLKSLGMSQPAGVSISDFKKQWKQYEGRKGKQQHYIQRKGGFPLRGPVVWTFDHTGELLEKDAVILGGSSLQGLNWDEDRMMYLACGFSKLRDGKPFLAGRGGNFGGPPIYKHNREPLTGTYVKTRGSGVRVLHQSSRLAPVALLENEVPKRPEDFHPYVDIEAQGWMGQEGKAWVEGAKWFYVGHSPINKQSCTCPQSRPGFDWYKRSYVLEMYRHSLGILDTNGNLIMHLGRYGNLDGVSGGDRISFCFTDQVVVTDNYLVYCDIGERLVVVKLNYHTEATIPINLVEGGQ